ncbi:MULTISPECIES: hypothetical protein [Neobacillus]|jgi:hypothetical protein|nr:MULTISPECIES: hypothetical protein [Neobacillus]MED3625208.1 hypothetical protein [Neobacillus thermocopriae]MED3715112.1 hypothetical protein [Neobacillus thermocopriae]
MVIWWILTIGFLSCLGLLGGTLVYFLKQALHSEDATRIDKIHTE